MRTGSRRTNRIRSGFRDRPHVVGLFVFSLAVYACSDAATAPEAAPLIITRLSGDNQSVTAGKQTAPLVVSVTRGGVPQAGIAVTWDGGGDPTTMMTDELGVSAVRWASGEIAGRYSATASITDAGVLSSVTFTTVIVPGPAFSVLLAPASFGGVQTGDTVRFTATVRDVYANALRDVAVAWTSLTPDIVSVDGAGRALALRQGDGRVKASIDGADVTGYVVVR